MFLYWNIKITTDTPTLDFILNLFNPNWNCLNQFLSGLGRRVDVDVDSGSSIGRVFSVTFFVGTT